MCKLVIGTVGEEEEEEVYWSGRDQAFPGNAVHKAELSSQTLLYQTLHARGN